MHCLPSLRRTPPPALLRNVFLLALAWLALPLAPARAQEKKPRDVSHFNLGKKGLALSGYDPVAYFEEGGGKPQKGSEDITTVHDGVLYRFSSEATKQLFLANPAKYEPEYGGWCAYAMADGDKVEIDPESFLIQGGKLYLFYKGWFNDTRAKWLKDPDKLQAKADKAWRKIITPKPEPKDA